MIVPANTANGGCKIPFYANTCPPDQSPLRKVGFKIGIWATPQIPP